MCRKQLLSLWLTDKGKKLRLSKHRSLENGSHGAEFRPLRGKHYQVSISNSRAWKKGIPELRPTSLRNKDCPMGGYLRYFEERLSESGFSLKRRQPNCVWNFRSGRLLEVPEKAEIASNYCWDQSLLSLIKIS